MSCLVCQPFTGSSVLQERILETSATTDSEYCSFGSTESLHCNQDHDNIQVMTREIPGEVVPIFVAMIILFICNPRACIGNHTCWHAAVYPAVLAIMATQCSSCELRSISTERFQLCMGDRAGSSCTALT